MSKKVAIVGVGAVGGYTGAHMVQAGEDVTFLDMWPAHVDEMKKNGLRITHHEGEEPEGPAGCSWWPRTGSPPTTTCCRRRSPTRGGCSPRCRCGGSTS